MKTSFVMLALCAGALLVSAPASAAQSLNLDKLLHTAKVDLDAAKADADSHGDKIASQCYAGIEAYAEANPISVQLPDIKGVASAFQVGRDGVKLLEAGGGASAGIPVDLELACGPLALDVQNDLGRAATLGLNVFGLKIF